MVCNELILGHEAFGQVLDVGSNVSSLRKIDMVINKMITKVVKPEEATSALMTKIRGEIKTIISWS
ncbi:MAG: alcohol dehydrogenase catalytic domain-containing protein [Sulfolobaceae archaeon]